jgi:2-amino-4-hydroxy-6-hydroxymethyldihydropteridine diphosphokinase
MGDRFANLCRAVDELRNAGNTIITGSSQIYETEPVGGPPQGAYLNAVVAVRTTLTPHLLLTLCRAIEDDMGRVRDIHWGPRVIDLDILIMGKTIIQDTSLVIPHPRLAERAFVLYPLFELAPDLIHPVLNVSISELRNHINGSGVKTCEGLVIDQGA